MSQKNFNFFCIRELNFAFYFNYRRDSYKIFAKPVDGTEVVSSYLFIVCYMIDVDYLYILI